MVDNSLYIKNMVCPRCIETVSGVLKQLEIDVLHIELGKVIPGQPITPEKKAQLESLLHEKGFELLEDKSSRIISAIKTLIIEQIHHRAEDERVNFSTLLADKLHQDYSSLSKLFSSTEGITIEKYILKQKIEKVKELIVYDELSLSQIADQLNYSSLAHLSAQFKKETGMTPSAFRKLEKRDRRPLDSL